MKQRPLVVVSIAKLGVAAEHRRSEVRVFDKIQVLAGYMAGKSATSA